MYLVYLRYKVDCYLLIQTRLWKAHVEIIRHKQEDRRLEDIPGRRGDQHANTDPSANKWKIGNDAIENMGQEQQCNYRNAESCIRGKHRNVHRDIRSYNGKNNMLNCQTASQGRAEPLTKIVLQMNIEKMMQLWKETKGIDAGGQTDSKSNVSVE